MSNRDKLMCVLAHPDDETLGAGGIIARYAAEGVDAYLITATSGEGGWRGEPGRFPGNAALVQIREAELHAAARILGIREGVFLNYPDGQVDRVDADEITAKISMHLRRLKPQVVITFDPFGVYGHPDHIAVSQFTHAAVLRAASEFFTAEDGYETHLVSKLYYMTETEQKFAQYQKVLGNIEMSVNGEIRRPVGWEPWAITTIIDTADYQDNIKQAMKCHASQFPDTNMIDRLFEQNLFDQATLYRVYSLVNSGSRIETDLFEGLQ
jgi:LmbE family N-acetylglucosaminyl deacetylase